jgi:hypothetical protein
LFLLGAVLSLSLSPPPHTNFSPSSLESVFLFFPIRSERESSIVWREKRERERETKNEKRNGDDKKGNYLSIF